MNISKTMMVLVIFLTGAVFAQGQGLIEPNEPVMNEASSSVVVKSDDDTNESDKLNKYEIGLHFTNIQFGTFDPLYSKKIQLIMFGSRPFVDSENNPKDPGIGARFTYNLNKNIAVEAEANWYFQKEYLSIQPSHSTFYPGGQKWQMLFGPKIGKRFKKVGVFGKVRPGFIQIVAFPVLTEIGSSGNVGYWLNDNRRTTFFNVDVGGVFEYYPTKRTLVRFDMGDTIIRFNAQEPKNINPSFTRHNLQINLGFGIRF